MNLTTSQLTLLGTHIRANTNTAALLPPDVGSFVINTPAIINGRDPTNQRAIANWYNGVALAADQQPFANLNVWNPVTTIQQLNSAMKFTLNSVMQGSTPTDAQVTNALLMWQVMTWSLGAIASVPVGLDMGDAQVRAGVLALWGDVTANPANAKLIGAVGCGQQVGKNIELVCSNAVAGASAGSAFAAAHPVQKDALGATIYGQLLTQADVDKALFPNG